MNLKSEPLLSVILCTNTLDEYFARALQSVQSQTYKNLEILLILNGEAERSDEFQLARQFSDPRLRILKTKVAHLNHSLNIGLDVARGQLVARMDADDICYPKRFEIQMEYMLSHPEVALCGTAYELIDSFDQPLRCIHPPSTSREINFHLFTGNPICHPTVVFRTDVIRGLGGYIGGLHAEDYDLWMRISQVSSYKMVNIPDVLLGYRSHSVGLARRSIQAYVSVSAAQWSRFVASGSPIWAVASMMTTCKRWFRSRRL